jgi:hypothetical protein
MTTKSYLIYISIAFNVLFTVAFCYVLFHYHLPQKVIKHLGINKYLPVKRRYMVMTGDALINSQWKKLLKQDDILFISNRSASIHFVIENIDKIIKSKPKICIITANGYDVYLTNDPESIFLKYKYLIDQLDGKGIRIVVQTALTAVPDRFSLVEYGENVTKFNVMLTSYCDANSIDCLELNKIMSLGYHYKPGYSNRNGIFPNRKGYEIWGQHLRDLLDKQAS